jgi:hypothetical protein
VSDNKTRPTNASVDEFLAAVEHPDRRADSLRLRALMEDATGESATMWGPGIVGFGSCHYRYATGREGDMPAVGFSPRKANLTIYVAGGFNSLEPILARLGKHKVGKGCLYLNRLADADAGALRDLILASVDAAAEIDAAAKQ